MRGWGLPPGQLGVPRAGKAGLQSTQVLPSEGPTAPSIGSSPCWITAARGARGRRGFQHLQVLIILFLPAAVLRDASCIPLRRHRCRQLPVMSLMAPACWTARGLEGSRAGCPAQCSPPQICGCRQRGWEHWPEWLAWSSEPLRCWCQQGHASPSPPASPAGAQPPNPPPSSSAGAELPCSRLHI